MSNQSCNINCRTPCLCNSGPVRNGPNIQVDHLSDDPTSNAKLRDLDFLGQRESRVTLCAAVARNSCSRNKHRITIWLQPKLQPHPIHLSHLCRYLEHASSDYIHSRRMERQPDRNGGGPGDVTCGGWPFLRERKLSFVRLFPLGRCAWKSSQSNLQLYKGGCQCRRFKLLRNARS